MKYEELKFENKETEKKDRELFNRYYNGNSCSQNIGINSIKR